MCLGRLSCTTAVRWRNRAKDSEDPKEPYNPTLYLPTFDTTAQRILQCGSHPTLCGRAVGLETELADHDGPRAEVLPSVGHKSEFRQSTTGTEQRLNSKHYAQNSFILSCSQLKNIVKHKAILRRKRTFWSHLFNSWVLVENRVTAITCLSTHG